MRFKWSTSRYAVLFNRHDDMAIGRSCIATAAMLQSVIATLSGGVFYTAFLKMNGISLVNVSIISFIPFIANCFSVFSPTILERFERRRWILAASRLAYYALNIIGITLVPWLIQDAGARIGTIIALIFLSNVILALFSSGYSVWHVKFLPNDIRADYFAANSVITGLAVYPVAVVMSVVADRLDGMANQETLIVAMRFAAFALAFIELFLLTRPVEYPYARSAAKPRFADIFVKSFQHKKFLLTMGLILAYNFTVNLSAGSLNYYLIDSVGVEYTWINVMNLTYLPFLMFLQPFAKKLVAKYGWFTTFAIGMLMTGPTLFLYGCVTAQNYFWLFPAVRVLQHFAGVSTSLTYANMPYVNLPPKDQTNYMSFYTLVANVGAFVGMMSGTFVVAGMGEAAIWLFGTRFGSVQVLLLLEGLFYFALFGGVSCLKTRLTPSAEVLD